jgi:hypothetical protein
MQDFNPENYYKTNLIIWSSIILGMVVLIGITYYLDQTNSFEPIEYALEVKNILFILILISALAILFLKRSFLDFQKIYDKIKGTQSSDTKMAFFSKLRSNYIIIWAIAESIIMIGFVEYILLCDFQSFMLYSIIGLYAIGINYPRKSLFDKHLQLLVENEG